MDLFPVVLFLQLLYAQESSSAILTSFVTTLERVKSTCDGDTITYCNSTVKKYNRTTPYMLYVYALIEKPLNNDFTMIMKSYEWKDNQYKESFISYKQNLCDFIEKDQLMAKVVKNFAALPKKCPFKVGEFILNDFWIKPGELPFGFPLSKWKLVFKIKNIHTDKIAGSFSIEFRVEELVKKRAG